MDQRTNNYKTFEDLITYQQAREFRKQMYAFARGLPNLEKFELGSQMRRAAVSLTNNIAEGHGRFHDLDQIKFLVQARGSLEELLDDQNVCADEKYLPDADIAKGKQQGWKAFQLLNGYMRFLRERKKNEALVLRDTLTKADDGLDERDFESDSTVQQFNDPAP